MSACTLAARSLTVHLERPASHDITMPIENVSDTARWVAVYRATESERPDALFHDPYARRLAGERGEEIVRTLPRGSALGWPMIVRTAVFDEVILECVRGRGVDLVVNLAAGLDTRAWRLDLPPTLRWVDVDLPGILDYKASAMAGEKPRCRYEAVAVDLTDAARRDALFAQLGRESQRALVVSEGLLIYLTAEDVAALARTLHAQSSFRWWVTDLGSPRLLRMMEKWWGSTVRAGNATFRFAPAEGSAFFEPSGWREAEWRGMMTESLRLRRAPRMIAVWRFLSRFRSSRHRREMQRFSGTLLLERS